MSRTFTFESFTDGMHVFKNKIRIVCIERDSVVSRPRHVASCVADAATPIAAAAAAADQISSRNRYMYSYKVQIL